MKFKVKCTDTAHTQEMMIKRMHRIHQITSKNSKPFIPVDKFIMQWTVHRWKGHNLL